MFGTVAIVGVGLLGGSLGMALRGLARHRNGSRIADRVIGIARRPSTIQEALQIGALDEGGLDLAAAAGADLVVVATPVLSMAPLFRALAPHLTDGALVTDVGSTKAALMEQLPSLLPPGVHFVGSHPMAGSEKGGVLQSDPDLYVGARWVVTRSGTTSDEAVARVWALAEAVGSEPLALDPREHDEIVARTSHLPHIAASALAAAAAAGGIDTNQLGALAAGGFRDSTRIAAASPEMWRDICITNRAPLLAALRDLQLRLSEFETALVNGDGDSLLRSFECGQEGRRQIALAMPERMRPR
jgi:prephenate dehydrogenase